LFPVNSRNRIWPGTTFDFRRRTRSFDPVAHLVHRPLPKQEAVGAPVETLV
jgi:hypothetical protein